MPIEDERPVGDEEEADKSLRSEDEAAPEPSGSGDTRIAPEALSGSGDTRKTIAPRGSGDTR